MSDGSTDGTDDIVKRYASEHDWIELRSRPPRKDRHFAGKVAAFNVGYSAVQHLSFEIVGSLDADITFSDDYFEFLLRRFRESPTLGVVGTPFREGNQQYNYKFTSIEHVSGACQLFRRDCFEDIGGYTPIKGGGIDLVAVTTARMKGWETRTFPDRVCIHHRQMGTAGNGSLKAAFRLGTKDYQLGTHPLWQLCRSCYQMTKRPLIVGGCMLLVGFSWAMLIRANRSVPGELIEFRRREQMRRLRQFLRL